MAERIIDYQKKDKCKLDSDKNNELNDFGNTHGFQKLLFLHKNPLCIFISVLSVIDEYRVEKCNNASTYPYYKIAVKKKKEYFGKEEEK